MATRITINQSLLTPIGQGPLEFKGTQQQASDLLRDAAASLVSRGQVRSGYLRLTQDRDGLTLGTNLFKRTQSTDQARVVLRSMIRTAYGEHAGIEAAIEAYLGRSSQRLGTQSFVKLIQALDAQTGHNPDDPNSQVIAGAKPKQNARLQSDTFGSAVEVTRLQKTLDKRIKEIGAMIEQQPLLEPAQIEEWSGEIDKLAGERDRVANALEGLAADLAVRVALSRLDRRVRHFRALCQGAALTREIGATRAILEQQPLLEPAQIQKLRAAIDKNTTEYNEIGKSSGEEGGFNPALSAALSRVDTQLSHLRAVYQEASDRRDSIKGLFESGDFAQVVAKFKEWAPHASAEQLARGEFGSAVEVTRLQKTLDKRIKEIGAMIKQQPLLEPAQIEEWSGEIDKLAGERDRVAKAMEGLADSPAVSAALSSLDTQLSQLRTDYQDASDRRDSIKGLFESGDFAQVVAKFKEWAPNASAARALDALRRVDPEQAQAVTRAWIDNAPRGGKQAPGSGGVNFVNRNMDQFGSEARDLSASVTVIDTGLDPIDLKGFKLNDSTLLIRPKDFDGTEVWSTSGGWGVDLTNTDLSGTRIDLDLEAGFGPLIDTPDKAKNNLIRVYHKILTNRTDWPGGGGQGGVLGMIESIPPEFPEQRIALTRQLLEFVHRHPPDVTWGVNTGYLLASMSVLIEQYPELRADEKLSSMLGQIREQHALQPAQIFDACANWLGRKSILRRPPNPLMVELVIEALASAKLESLKVETLSDLFDALPKVAEDPRVIAKLNDAPSEYRNALLLTKSSATGLWRPRKDR